MGAWNLKEFKTFCLNSGLDKALHYTNSLAFKWNAAKYHKGNILQKIKEITPSSFLEKAPAYDYEIAFELDALMASLNSMWDILGQLVNECFISPKIEMNIMFFNDIYNCYWDSIPKVLQQTLTPIKGNELYNIIKTFNTTSKHRGAPKGEIYMDVSENISQVSYIV